MRHNRRCRGSDHSHPANAAIVVSPCLVFISDGAEQKIVRSSAVKRSQVLTQAQGHATAAGCRVLTSFPAEQIELWANYTRMPRVFMTHSCLLSILSVLEVADMLDDATSATSMCKAFAHDYVAPLAHPRTPAASEQGTEAAATPVSTPRKVRLRPRCKHPQPYLAVRHAFLWGAGLGSEVELGEVGPAEAPPCCAAAARAKHPSAALHRPQGKPGTVLKALEALPEHLLLRVLRAWAAPLPTQLATLPRRMHAAIIAAAYASVDSSRSISLGGLDPQPFRCALRAVAALASMQRVDTITLAPPHRGSVRQQASECMGPMQLIARHLCPLVAITSLHLTSMPRVWLGSNNLRQLSCVTCMPHLRAVGVDDVKQSLVPALVATLARMPHLCELKLGVCMVPVVVDGGWGGAGLVRQLIALTALEAVNLKLQYKRVSIRSDAGFLDSAAPLLRAVDEKRVSLLPQLQYFCWEGKRRPADVLGALWAAAPRLDLARCGVEERGEGRYVSMAPPAVKALWGALMTAPEVSAPVAVHMLNSGISRFGMRVNPETDTIDVPPAALGDLPGLQHFIMQGPEERPVDGGDAAALGRQLYKLTQLTTLDCNEAKLGGAAARLLLPQLSALLALQELNLEGCCIGADGGEALAAALPRLGTLRHLNLEQNDLGERGCAAVMAALAPDAAAGMNSLRLGWNCIGLGGAAALAARLPEMTALTELHLAANRLMGGEGVAALQGGLAARGVRLTALKNLELQRNFLECHGATALAGMLLCFPKLESVCLQANAIGARGMRALAQQVGHMQRLESLDMSYNCVGDVGAQALAHMFRRTVPGRVVLPEYMLYDLEQNGIADAGALALAGALLDVVGCGSTAYHVRLQGNEVSAGMWNHIARRTLHVNRPKHRLALCQGGYCTDQTSPEEMHEMMAG